MTDPVEAILLGRVQPASMAAVLERHAGLFMNPEMVEDTTVKIAFVEDGEGRQFGTISIFSEEISHREYVGVFDGERTLVGAAFGLADAARVLVEEFGGYLRKPGAKGFVLMDGRRSPPLTSADALLLRLQKAVSFTAAKAVRDAIVADPELAADLVAGIEKLPTAATAPSPR
jgi:hypothetical protein